MRCVPVLQVFVHGDSLQVRSIIQRIDPCTTLHLTKRVVNYLTSSCISCYQSYLIGIVVPDPEVFVNWAKERGSVGSYEELCHNPVHQIFSVENISLIEILHVVYWVLVSIQDVKNAVLEDMKTVGKKAGLLSFEQVRTHSPVKPNDQM